jgi:hypothetical protein
VILRNTSDPAPGQLTREQHEVLDSLGQALDHQLDSGSPEDRRRHHHIGVNLTAAMAVYLERRYRGRGWDSAEVRRLPSGAHLLLVERTR